MGKSDPKNRSFDIPKSLVWKAYKSVKEKKGAAGVDVAVHRGVRSRSEEQSVQDLGEDVLGDVLPSGGKGG